MEEITFKPIGTIHSPFKQPKGTPIQPPAARDVEGKIKLLPRFTEGLKDIEGFSHLILLYHFHLAKKTAMTAKPFMEDIEHGILFMTCAPLCIAI